MPLNTLKLRNLGAKGVISDLAPYDTDLSCWTYANNVRFSNGRARKISGHLPLFFNNREGAMEWNGKAQIPMHLELSPQLDPTSEEWIYCTSNTIWRTDGWTHKNMHPEDAYDMSDPSGGKKPFDIDVVLEAPWSSTTISNSVILNSTRLAAPLGLGKGEDKFKPLPNWGPGVPWTATTMRSYKNFVMAVGGGEEYPQRVRWSNIVPPNALPADWGWQYLYSAADEEADSTHKEGTPIPVGEAIYGQFINGSAGGYNDLSFSKGALVDGRQLKDQFILYTDQEVISCDYVGGNDIFRFRSLFDDGGAFNPDCIAVFENKHFVVSAHDIYIHNGSSKESVIDMKVRTTLLDQITANSASSVKVVPYLPENEIWVIYAGPSAVGLTTETAERKEATKAAIFNYRTNVWSFADLPRTLDIKLGPSPFFVGEKKKASHWEELADTFLWEDSLDLWNTVGGSSTHNLREYSLVCASSDGGFYVLDKTDNFYTLGDKVGDQYRLIATPILATLGKDYIDLDEATDTLDYKTILALWPQVIGTGELSIQVGGAHVPGGGVTWDAPVTYVCSKDRKVDIRQNYRYLCISIEGKGAGTWSLSGFDAVLRIGGRR